MFIQHQQLYANEDIITHYHCNKIHSSLLLGNSLVSILQVITKYIKVDTTTRKLINDDATILSECSAILITPLRLPPKTQHYRTFNPLEQLILTQQPSNTFLIHPL